MQLEKQKRIIAHALLPAPHSKYCSTSLSYTLLRLREYVQQMNRPVCPPTSVQQKELKLAGRIVFAFAFPTIGNFPCHKRE